MNKTKVRKNGVPKSSIELFPIKGMKIGDSFLIKNADFKNVNSMRVMLYTYVYRFNQNRKMKVRIKTSVEPKGVRVCKVK